MRAEKEANVQRKTKRPSKARRATLKATLENYKNIWLIGSKI